MLKKDQVLQALENGGHIMVDSVYRTATVYDENGERLDCCRYDTADRIRLTEGYKRTFSRGWALAWHIEKEQPAPEEAAQDEEIKAFPIITKAAQREFEADAQGSPDETPAICGSYGRGCRQMDAAEGANRAICQGCPLAAYCQKAQEEAEAEADAYWQAESERVQAAVSANLPGLVTEEAQEEQPAPDYLRENWPTSNENPAIYYSIEHAVPGSAGAWYKPAQTVDDLQSKLAQLQAQGCEIRAAWRHDRETGERRQFIPETRQEQTDRENREHCKRIAEELELYASGDAYKCPHCGGVHDMDEYEETEHEDENGYTCYTCPNCCEEIEEDDLEAVSIYDFFEDCLDIEYRCDARKEYRSVAVMVTCGGPNIYIDTEEKAVLLYWWGDRARYYLSSDAVDAVDAWAAEYWEVI